jgi:hypothetical protein
MTYQIGLMLAFGALALLGLILTLFRINPRDDREEWREFTEHQWKDIRKQDFRRRMEDRARKERAGIR